MNWSSGNSRFDIPSDPNHIVPTIPDFSDQVFSERAQRILQEWGLNVELEWKDGTETEMDLFLLPRFKSASELRKLIIAKIWIDIWTKEWIKKVWVLLKEASDFYVRELWRNIPRELLDYKFKRQSDVMSFIEKTINWNRRQTYCNIVKVIFLLWELRKEERLKHIDEKARIAIRDRFRFFQFNDPDFPIKKNVTTWCLTKWDKTIKFTLRFRAKSETSNILKMWYNPDYYSADLLNDAIWLEFEVSTSDDAVIIQSTIYEKLWMNDSNYRLEDKWMLDHQSAWESDDNNSKEQRILLDWGDSELLSSDFIELCSIAKTGRKKNTPKKYKDLKSVFKMNVRKNPDREDSQKIPASFEVKTILSDNRNEAWLANHKIYDYFKRVLFIIRLQWYVTENYLKFIINKMFDENPELQFNKDEVLEHYKKSLTSVSIPKTKIVYYVSPNRRNVMSQEWALWYPDRFS